MILFFKLLISHLISDFFLQPNKWVEDKKANKIKSPYLYYHILVTGAVASLFVADINLWHFILLIMGTHLIIDIWKLYIGEGLYPFLIDQLAHVLVLAIIAGSVSNINHSVIRDILDNPYFWAVSAGYLFISVPAGYVVGMATERWRKEIDINQNSLPNAGVWIGIVERLLVYTFVLIGQFGAVGLLIAAKSILRFGGASEQNSSKQSEYVLIGTLISFSIALLTALIVQKTH